MTALSWALGAAYALLDWALLRLEPERASRVLAAGLGGRYALTVAVLGAAVLIPAVDAVAVVLPLIAQKALLVLAALLPKRKKDTENDEGPR